MLIFPCASLVMILELSAPSSWTLNDAPWIGAFVPCLTLLISKLYFLAILNPSLLVSVWSANFPSSVSK